MSNSHLPRFTETFVDDGYIDMIEALRELRKAPPTRHLLLSDAASRSSEKSKIVTQGLCPDAWASASLAQD